MNFLSSVRVVKTDEKKRILKKYKLASSLCWILAKMVTRDRDIKIWRRTRMENEVRMSNFLRKIGYDTPKILGVNHKSFTITREYITRSREEEESLYRIGEELGSLHRDGILLIDTKPDNFLTTRNKVYIRL